jgi:glycosyltransferase involved in cell wall biosynthesis
VGPVLSIVIPVKGQQKYTYQCLQSIRQGTKLPYEVLIIDSPSDDRFDPTGWWDMPLVVEYVSEAAEPRPSLYELCNRAAAKARGDFLAIINNDIIVGQRTFDNLIDAMRRFGLKAATPVTTDALDDLPHGFYAEAELRSTLPCEVVPPQTGSPWRGWFLMLTLSAWNEVKGFDPRFVIWYGDDDFYRRFEEKFGAPRQIANTYVHHFQSKTPRAPWMNASEDKKLFEQKWPTPIAP